MAITGLKRASLAVSVVKNQPANAADSGDTGLIPELEDPLEKEMVTHPRIPASERPWTEGPSGLQYMGSKRDMTEQLSTQHWSEGHW